jgi:hypothetical protein
MMEQKEKDEGFEVHGGKRDRRKEFLVMMVGGGSVTNWW